MKEYKFHRWLILITVFGLALLLLLAPSINRIRLIWADSLQRTKASNSPKHTVIVGLDMQSTKALGWPLSKDLYAAAINAVSIAEPKGIGIDLFFAEKKEFDEEYEKKTIENEVLLGTIVSKSGAVLSSWILTMPENKKKNALPATGNKNLIPGFSPTEEGARSFLQPLLPKISEKLPKIAHVHISSHSFDGISRFISPCIALHDGFIPDLASAVTGIYPTPPECTTPILVPLTASFENFPFISMIDLLTAAQNNPEKLKKLFRGKYVLVAATDPTLRDLGPTTASEMEPLVSVHANRIESLIEGRTITIVHLSIGVLLSLLYILIVLLFFGKLRQIIVATLLALTVPFAISWLLFMQFDIIFSPLFFALPVVFSLLAIIGFDSWRYFLFNTMLSNAFGAYVSPDVLQWIQQTGGSVLRSDNATKRELTIMFSDIAGYTSLSNSLSPDGVMQSLGLYLDTMLSIATEFGGYVDKINGDGLMILFGAPEVRENHAQQAIDCGIAMQNAVTKIQKDWDEITSQPLLIRIGIATGEVFVGNIGGSEHIEYTAIGRDVNLAARLESASEKGGILISSTTLNELSTKPDGRWREVALKGYSESVKVWQCDDFLK
ncbi:adenylate/guanylate cyclase domain-containing protein [bacterium]|nr:adenylate/guanylate cyclase domain-containing protein [bacterium]